MESLKLLLGSSLKLVAADAVSSNDLAQATKGVIVLLADPAKAKELRAKLHRYAETDSGRTVVLDTAAYAAMHGLKTEKVASRQVRITADSSVTAGLKTGDQLVLHGQGGVLQALPQEVAKIKDVSVLAVAGADDSPALVEHRIGAGRMVASDLLTPAEPYIWDSGSFNKYLFLTNAIGNGVRFGEFLRSKPTHAELVKQMQSLAAAHDTITCRNEGPASDGQDIYSLSFGNPQAPGLLILGSLHGNEWENSPGLVLFMRHVAERHAELGIDPKKVYLRVVPVVSTFGYDKVSRLNANGVNLNRNGDTEWESYTAADTNGDGVYGPGDQDWKGSGPLSEPETQVLMKILKSAEFSAVLDLHSNPSGTRYNKLIYARSESAECMVKVKAISEHFNLQIAGRYILRQQHEKEIKTISNELVLQGGRGPMLNRSAFMAQGRHSILVEIPGGIWTKNPQQSTYGTIMFTDLVSEMCLAFIRACSSAPTADN